MHHAQAFATSYTAHSPRPTTSPRTGSILQVPLIHLQYHCLGLLFRQCMILQILHLPTHSYFTGTTTGVTSPTTPTLTQYLSISRTISILLYKLQKKFFLAHNKSKSSSSISISSFETAVGTPATARYSISIPLPGLSG